MRNKLEQYIDAKESIETLRKELKILEARRGQIMVDFVSSSNDEFPYQPTRVRVKGVSSRERDLLDRIRRTELSIEKQLAVCEELICDVEAWLATVSPRAQRITRLRYFDNRSWGEIASDLGRNATGESVRKEFERALKSTESAECLYQTMSIRRKME